MTIINFVYVAIGGAVGSMARYGVSLALANSSLKAFPLATLVVNIVGSFLLAIVYLYAQHHSSQQTLWLLLGVGLLGAFTTFSTFSLEVVQLLQQAAWFKAVAVASLNFICCIAAVAVGLWLKPFLVNYWN
ncbi:fluoride efflux transporter CrcB [Pseudidiomarina aestuarii]|uniref:fluoride efflux transporter CrcB n=1 Tax=Pseudidiomarina aestuarii TaxID=624146 RepID=UPI003A971C3A